VVLLEWLTEILCSITTKFNWIRIQVRQEKNSQAQLSADLIYDFVHLETAELAEPYFSLY